MTHRELENLISDYLEGHLDTARRAEAEHHLADCLECRSLVAEVRHAFDLCRAAQPLEPPPWLVPKILRATVGERKPGWRHRLLGALVPALNVRVASGVAMTVFSLAVLMNATGVRLTGLRAQDLNPVSWVGQANRSGHLLLGRAEKYYYDLKVVYEIESRLRQLRAQPSPATPGRPAPSRRFHEGPAGARDIARLLEGPAGPAASPAVLLPGGDDSSRSVIP